MIGTKELIMLWLLKKLFYVHGLSHNLTIILKLIYNLNISLQVTFDVSQSSADK